VNTSRLLEIISALLQQESNLSIHGTLQQLSQNFTNVSQNPGNPQFQTDLASTLEGLRDLGIRLKHNFDPTQTDTMKEIGASPFFTEEFITEIDSWVRNNPMTPAVVNQNLRITSLEGETILIKSQPFATTCKRSVLPQAPCIQGKRKLDSLSQGDFSGIIWISWLKSWARLTR
jgi:hypothetical protein